VAHEVPGEKVTRYTPELSTTAAVAANSWTIKSLQDPSYGSTGKNPTACSRKKKLSGHAQLDWVSSDYAYEYTYQLSRRLQEHVADRRVVLRVAVGLGAQRVHTPANHAWQDRALWLPLRLGQGHRAQRSW
jgi:hypothetical protein